MSQFLTRAQIGLVPPKGAYQRITPEGITVHYQGPSPWTGGVFRPEREASIWRADQAYHMSPGALGSPTGGIDIAYTAGFGPSGVGYEGRPPWARTAAQGTNDGNTRSLAFLYMAGEGDPLTDEAKIAMVEHAALLGLPLRWPHRFWFNTSCPGDPTFAWYQAGFPRPGGAPPPQPDPILPPRQISTITLTGDDGDDEMKQRLTFDCGELDGEGHGSVLFDGGANGDGRIMHFVVIRYAAMRGLWVQGSYPPVDGNRGLPVAGPQERDGFLCVEFDGGPPRGPVTLLVDVAT